MTCPNCGSKKFIGWQKVTVDVKVYVDENGDYIEDCEGAWDRAEVIDAERPTGCNDGGYFRCAKCGNFVEI